MVRLRLSALGEDQGKAVGWVNRVNSTVQVPASFLSLWDVAERH